MIVLGADVGKSTGLVVLDCSGARPRYLAAALGRETLVDVTRTIFQAHDIRLVGIETPSQVFEHGRAQESEGARRSIERALLVARDAAGQVRAVAGMSGAEVHDGQAHHVRRAVLGKLPKTGVDRFIATRLPLLVDGWPARSNDHERDAAIVALWAWQRAKVGLKPGESALRSKVKRSRPTVGDLRDAAARALSKPRASDGCHERPEIVRALDQIDRGPDPTPSRRALEREAGAFSRDPGEERTACMLVPCEVCGAPTGKPCRFFGGEVGKYKAHPARAKAAGHEIDVAAAVIERHHGPRKLATVRPVECWAVLPWFKPCKAGCVEGRVKGGMCSACDGLDFKAVRWKAAEEKGALAEVVMPLEARRHAWGEVCGACKGTGGEVIDDGLEIPYDKPCADCQGHGRVLRMIRRPWRRAGVECWLYEPAT